MDGVDAELKLTHAHNNSVLALLFAAAIRRGEQHQRRQRRRLTLEAQDHAPLLEPQDHANMAVAILSCCTLIYKCGPASSLMLATYLYMDTLC